MSLRYTLIDGPYDGKYVSADKLKEVSIRAKIHIPEGHTVDLVIVRKDGSAEYYIHSAVPGILFYRGRYDFYIYKNQGRRLSSAISYSILESDN